MVVGLSSLAGVVEGAVGDDEALDGLVESCTAANGDNVAAGVEEGLDVKLTDENSDDDAAGLAAGLGFAAPMAKGLTVGAPADGVNPLRFGRPRITRGGCGADERSEGASFG